MLVDLNFEGGSDLDKILKKLNIALLIIDVIIIVSFTLAMCSCRSNYTECPAYDSHSPSSQHLFIDNTK